MPFETRVLKFHRDTDPAENQKVETILLGLESCNGNDASVIDLQPPNYLRRALIALALCFPVGLPALIISLLVDRKFRDGDVEGAGMASKKALKSSQIAILVGTVTWVILFLLFICGVLFGILYLIGYYQYYHI